MKEKPPEEVPEYIKTGRKPIPDATLPEEYRKPMVEMMNRFAGTALDPTSPACCPIGVAVAIAIVIVLWDVPVKEMALTRVEKEALEYAIEQIKADHAKVQYLTGIEMTRPQIRLMEVLAQ